MEYQGTSTSDKRDIRKTEVWILRGSTVPRLVSECFHHQGMSLYKCKSTTAED